MKLNSLNKDAYINFKVLMIITNKTKFKDLDNLRKISWRKTQKRYINHRERD